MNNMKELLPSTIAAVVAATVSVADRADVALDVAGVGVEGVVSAETGRPVAPTGAVEATVAVHLPTCCHQELGPSHHHHHHYYYHH